MNKIKCGLIEEDKMLASLIGFRLKRMQFEVHHVGNDNIKALKGLGDGIVVVGLHSTTPNVINILSDIKATIDPKTPLFVIVSNKRQKSVIENHKIQVDAFLTSPVNLSALENEITQILKVENTVIQEGFRKSF